MFLIDLNDVLKRYLLENYDNYLWQHDYITYILDNILHEHKSYIMSISISNDNKYIASGSDDKTIRIWNMLDYKQLKILIGHESSVESIAILQDNKYIISGSWDETIRIWDIENGKQLKILEEHSITTTPVLEILQDNRYIVSGLLDGTIKIWKLIFQEEPISILKKIYDIHSSHE